MKAFLLLVGLTAALHIPLHSNATRMSFDLPALHCSGEFSGITFLTNATSLKDFVVGNFSEIIKTHSDKPLNHTQLLLAREATAKWRDRLRHSRDVPADLAKYLLHFQKWAGRKIHDDEVCDKELLPVCARNTTFKNVCFAARLGHKEVKMGHCSRPFFGDLKVNTTHLDNSHKVTVTVNKKVINRPKVKLPVFKFPLLNLNVTANSSLVVGNVSEPVTQVKVTLPTVEVHEEHTSTESKHSDDKEEPVEPKKSEEPKEPAEPQEPVETKEVVHQEPAKPQESVEEKEELVEQEPAKPQEPVEVEEVAEHQPVKPQESVEEKDEKRSPVVGEPAFGEDQNDDGIIEESE